jgi:streptogramin lyase
MKKNTIFKYCTSLAMGLALCSELSASWTNQIIAGQLGQSGYSGDGGPATSAKLANGLRESCADNFGNLFIADSSNGVIRKVNSGGIISTFISSGLSSPFGICADSSENVYVSNFGNGTIGKYSSTGSVINASLISGLSNPYGICLDSAGNLYIGNYGSSTLGKYSSTGTVINASLISGLSSPTGVYVDDAGSIYVTEASSGTLAKYSATGSSINSNLIPGISNPNGVCLDGSGNVYVGDTNNGRIQKLSASDSSISTIVSGLSNPYGICADSSGNLYVSDSGNAVVRKLFIPKNLTVDVEGSDSASHSGAITAGTVYKTNAGSLALGSTSNAIGALAINGGKVSVSSASNLNGASSAVTFAASGTDPVSHASNTATLEIAGSMNTGAFAFSTAGTVQVDSTYTATLNAAPTGTGLVHKTGPGVMKVASDLSASATLAGINVDAGTFYLYGGKAPNAPIDVASGAVFELGGASALGQHAVPGLTTVRSGGEISVDANTSINTDATTNYTMNFVTGYLVGAGTGAVLPHPTGLSVTGLNSSGYAIYLNSTASSILYGSMNFPVGTTDPAATMIPTTYNQITYSPFDTGVLFASGSTLKLGAGSTWARNITVGTAS